MLLALENIVRRFVGSSRCEIQPEPDLRRWSALVDRIPDEFVDVLARGDAAVGATPSARNDPLHDISDDPRSVG
jgi:hypothetical protein